MNRPNNNTTESILSFVRFFYTILWFNVKKTFNLTNGLWLKFNNFSKTTKKFSIVRKSILLVRTHRLDALEQSQTYSIFSFLYLFKYYKQINMHAWQSRKVQRSGRLSWEFQNWDLIVVYYGLYLKSGINFETETKICSLKSHVKPETHLWLVSVSRVPNNDTETKIKVGLTLIRNTKMVIKKHNLTWQSSFNE